MSKPAIFLDRDGVIVESRHAPDGSTPPVSIDDLMIPDGTAAALHTLGAAGYCLVVVTNQPDVARGSISMADVNAINEALRAELHFDAVYVCAHSGPGCNCRKPLPGMLLDAAHDLDLDLHRSWLVGDRWVDIAAGAAAGVRTVLVERVWSWNPTSSGAPPADLVPDFVAPGLPEAAERILG